MRKLFTILYTLPKQESPENGKSPKKNSPQNGKSRIPNVCNIRNKSTVINPVFVDGPTSLSMHGAWLFFPKAFHRAYMEAKNTENIGRCIGWIGVRCRFIQVVLELLGYVVSNWHTLYVLVYIYIHICIHCIFAWSLFCSVMRWNLTTFSIVPRSGLTVQEFGFKKASMAHIDCHVWSRFIYLPLIRL